MAKVIQTGTFKELLRPGFIASIKTNGKEEAFNRLRKQLAGTRFEQDLEELYNELA